MITLVDEVGHVPHVSPRKRVRQTIGDLPVPMTKDGAAAQAFAKASSDAVASGTPPAAAAAFAPADVRAGVDPAAIVTLSNAASIAVAAAVTAATSTANGGSFQAYEDTTGLAIVKTGLPLSSELGPGILEGI